MTDERELCRLLEEPWKPASQAMANAILARASLDRLKLILAHPDRRGRWRTLAYLLQYLDEALALVPEASTEPAPAGQAVPARSPVEPSGIAAAAAEDPEPLDAQYRAYYALKDRIRAEAAARFGGRAEARFGGARFRRAGGEE